MDIKSEFKTILQRDKAWSRTIRLKNLPSPLRHASKALSYSGDSRLSGAALVLLWLVGNTFWKEWAITVALGLATLAVLQLPLKRLIGWDWKSASTTVPVGPIAVDRGTRRSTGCRSW